VTIKKKLIVSTIAASLAATAFAGIPLSNKGLAEKLGFSATAYAAEATSVDQIIAAANEWHAALDSTGGLAAVKALRTAIQSLDPAVVKAAVEPVTDNFKDSLNPTEIGLIQSLYVDLIGFTFDSDLSYFDDIRGNGDYKDLAKELALAADVSLTEEDLAAYFLQVKSNLMTGLAALSDDQVKALATNPVNALNLLQTAVEAIPDTSKLKKVFSHYEVTSAEVKSSAISLVALVNLTTLQNAANAIINAYLELRTDDSGSGTGGGGVIGGGEETVVKVPTAVTDLLKGFKDQLAAAPDAEKPALIAKAIAAAQALVTQLANQDLSKDVTVSGGTASLQVSSSSVLSAIAGIGELLKTAKELAPGVALPAVVLNINLGNIAQNDVNIGLNNAVIQEAIKAGLSGINLTVNGLSAVLPVGGQFNGAVDFKINKSKADSTTTGGLQAASDVYSFGLTIGGQSVTSFAQPVIVSVPLGNVDGVDKELLSLAKIVDGKLVFQGGSVQGNTIIEHRDTFSQYVVVENKVTFSDIASVQAWAGRAIEVIAAKGAIEGKKAGVFAPKDNVTRAEFAKMLTRALDLDNSLAKESFADVADSNWAAPYIGAASKLGIIQGRSASKFDPNAQITRAEMATMIARALKVTKGATDVADVNAALANFKDASSISAALKAGVAFASSHEIVIGNNGKFSPNASATRAEAAVMIYRAVNFK
jgi:hypothetical protein